MASVNHSQIKALIRLLSDNDIRIARTISDKLVEIGDMAIPLLQEAELEQPEIGSRIVTILEEIRGGNLEHELCCLLAAQDEHLDLEQGAFLLARYAYPSLDVESYRRNLDEMASEVRARIGPRFSGEEAVKALGRYLFVEQGFRGNTKNYYDVENSFLNRVMDRRMGIPISLSMLYLLIAKRLAWPVFGVGMPGHFLVKYESERYKVFIDCFNGGALLAERDCARFLTQAGYGFEERFLHKTSNQTILLRSLKNLVPIYHKLEDSLRESRLCRFVQILECQNQEDSN